MDEDAEQSFYDAGRDETHRVALEAWDVIETVFGEAVRLPISIEKISTFYNMDIQRPRACVIKNRWTYFRDALSDDGQRPFGDFENRREASIIVAKKLGELRVCAFLDKKEARVFSLALLAPIFPLKLLLRSGMLSSDLERVFNMSPVDVDSWRKHLEDSEKACSCQNRRGPRYEIEATNGKGESISGCVGCLEASNIEVYNGLKSRREFALNKKTNFKD